MSSGQKAVYEESMEMAHKAHIDRLSNISLEQLAVLATDMQRYVKLLETESLTRGGWFTLNALNATIMKLS